MAELKATAGVGVILSPHDDSSSCYLTTKIGWGNTEQTAEYVQEGDIGTHDLETEEISFGFSFLGGSGLWPHKWYDQKTVAANTFGSYISQADADQKALLYAQSLLRPAIVDTYPLLIFWPRDEFAFDDCEAYNIGSIGSLYGGCGWTSIVAPFTPIDYAIGYDSIEVYPIGPISFTTSGIGWSAAGTFITLL